MRVGFVTCVRLGLSCMEAIYEAGGALQLVITLRDDLAVAKSGRVFVDAFCGARGIPLRKVRNINDDDALDAIRAAELDWLFIIGWSQIAGAPVLNSTRNGVLGMHPTLLPIGRGRAAIPWAILKGLTETGVTLFRLDTGVDTGPILAQVRVPIDCDETATTLYEKIDLAHTSLLRKFWAQLSTGRLKPVEQDDSSASLWPGRKPEDGRLDPAMTVSAALLLIRAVTRPYPGAFIDNEGERLRIWSARHVSDNFQGRHVANGVRSSKVIDFLDGSVELVDWESELIPATK